ncbi:MAG: DUF4249 domain-containing protein [Bacteroidota bacterium]
MAKIKSPRATFNFCEPQSRWDDRFNTFKKTTMKNIQYIAFLLSSFLLLNCGGENFFDSIVEVEIPPHEANLAVTAHLTNLDELFSLVFVTRTIGVLDDQAAEPITDAQVELYSDGQLLQTYEYIELFQNIDRNGDTIIRDAYFVENPVPLVASQTYELRVSSPIYGEVMATQALPQPTPIISVTYEEDGVADIFDDFGGIRADEITINFQDEATEKNYYLAEVFPCYLNPDVEDCLVTSPYLVPVDPATEVGVKGSSLLLSDATFNGKAHELKIATKIETDNLKRIEVILYNISEDRYLHELSLVNYQDNEDNPFAEPVIVHENITNGNGIFTLSSGSVFTIEF